MNIDRPRSSIVILLSATFASLIFYPLFSELHDNILILQWRWINTMELFCVFLAVSLFVFLALCQMYKSKNIYLKLLILSLICFMPCMSFFVYILKQLSGAGSVIKAANLIFSMPVMAVLISCFVFMSARYPRRVFQTVILLIFILSPLNILSLWSIIKSFSEDTVISIVKIKDTMQSQAQHKPDNNILIILFDELSYEYLYKNGKIKPEYQNLRRLSLVSDNYHNALSPGEATLTAIPGLIMGRRFAGVGMKYNQIYKITKEQEDELLTVDSNNLFAYAKNAGYKTFCFGPYLHYCKLFGKWLDEGRSFSVYNYGSLRKTFSIYNPILTTIILLPHQFPYSIFKNPVCSLWQKNILKQSYVLTMNAINTSEPFFIFVHFYPPHLPFAFDKNGYYVNKKPFLQNYENYSKQVDYVDVLMGNLIAELKSNGKFEDTIIVVLADHNYRIMFPDSKRSVPLIIKHKGQQTFNDIYDSAETQVVLKKELFDL